MSTSDKKNVQRNHPARRVEIFRLDLRRAGPGGAMSGAGAGKARAARSPPPNTTAAAQTGDVRGGANMQEGPSYEEKMKIISLICERRSTMKHRGWMVLPVQQ